MEIHERFYNKENKPTRSQIKKALGNKVLTSWTEITNYIDSVYHIKPEKTFGGKNYGWSFKYRKSGMTLCSIFPEKESFTVQIVFAQNDLENLSANFSTLSKSAQKLITATKQYFDGRWVKFRLPNDANLKDIKTMLTAKLKPN